MNFQDFKSYIKTLDSSKLDEIFDELNSKLKRARNPQVRLGYAMAIDEVVIEKNLKRYDAPSVLSVDELFSELCV